MATLDLAADHLTYRLLPWEKFLAAHGDVVVPYGRIGSVRAVADLGAELRGFRCPGYAFPGHRALGTWRRRHGKDFVDVRFHRPGVVVELTGHGFSRLLLPSDDAETLARRLSSLAVV
jgi:hypothetical protein